jgi:hypothetical protein
MFENVNFKELCKNSSEKSILIGMIIGDGWINFNRKTSYISFYHSPKQEEYIRFKALLLEELDIFGTINYSPKTKSNYPKWKYWSKSDRRINLYRLMYAFRNTPEKRRKRIIPKMLNYLDELGIALWFMDDGYNDPKRQLINLATQSFTYEENQIIQKWFSNKWKIEFNIYRRKDKYFLVTYKDAKKFKNLVKPFIEKLECMNYKITNC